MGILCILDSMSKIFQKAYIEISDICGLKCSFCPAPKGRRGAMELEVFEKIAQEIRGRAKVVTFHLLGDPLLSSDLSFYLQIAQQYNLQVEIVTSGFYLKKWDFEKLLSLPIVQCNISLSAFSDSANPSPKDYLKNVLDFCDFHQRVQSECFLNLRMHQSREQKQITQFFCSYYGADDGFVRNRIRLGYKLFLRLSKDFEWVRAQSNQSKEEQKFCYGVISQIGFLSTGEVVPCCIDCDGGLILGDIRTQSLEEILNSQKAINIKEGFKRGVAVEEQCQKCTYPAKSKMD